MRILNYVFIPLHFCVNFYCRVFYIYLKEKIEMDLENVPDIKITEKKREEMRNELRKSLEEYDEYFDSWVSKMRKAGYSNKQIDASLYF